MEEALISESEAKVDNDAGEVCIRMWEVWGGMRDLLVEQNLDPDYASPLIIVEARYNDFMVRIPMPETVPLSVLEYMWWEIADPETGMCSMTGIQDMMTQERMRQLRSEQMKKA